MTTTDLKPKPTPLRCQCIAKIGVPFPYPLRGQKAAIIHHSAFYPEVSSDGSLPTIAWWMRFKPADDAPPLGVKLTLAYPDYPESVTERLATDQFYRLATLADRQASRYVYAIATTIYRVSIELGRELCPGDDGLWCTVGMPVSPNTQGVVTRESCQIMVQWAGYDPLAKGVDIASQMLRLPDEWSDIRPTCKKVGQWLRMLDKKFPSPRV